MLPAGPSPTLPRPFEGRGLAGLRALINDILVEVRKPMMGISIQALTIKISSVGTLC